MSGDIQSMPRSVLAVFVAFRFLLAAVFFGFLQKVAAWEYACISISGGGAYAMHTWIGRLSEA